MEIEDFDVELAKTYEHARKLECERNAAIAENSSMRSAIKEAYKLVRWLSLDTTGLQFRTANSALSILQPYLK